MEVMKPLPKVSEQYIYPKEIYFTPSPPQVCNKHSIGTAASAGRDLVRIGMQCQAPRRGVLTFYAAATY